MDLEPVQRWKITALQTLKVLESRFHADKCRDTFDMTFVVQTQIDIFFNDGQSEFDGF